MADNNPMRVSSGVRKTRIKQYLGRNEIAVFEVFLDSMCDAVRILVYILLFQNAHLEYLGETIMMVSLPLPSLPLPSLLLPATLLLLLLLVVVLEWEGEGRGGIRLSD